MTDQSAKTSPPKRVAIVVPLSNRAELLPEEEISYRHLVHFLGHYDKYVVAPEGLDIDFPGFGVERFDGRFFGSAAANTQLMLSRPFYRRFQTYEYILIYHLDALVFSDQLEQWCTTEMDYIGPPWFQSDDTPWVKTPGVGNGGFSLRKVASCLKVLNSTHYRLPPDEYWARYCATRPKLTQFVNWPRKYFKYLRPFNNIDREIAQFKNNEDRFWSLRAEHYYPGFKMADVDTALRFAFEAEPSRCFERTNHTLPFGCHAWPKYDRAFWEPYLIGDACT